MKDLFDLSGRRALVTGSSRGIGAAIAEGLAGAGAAVVVHYAGRREAAGAVADRIRGAGGTAAVAGADLGDADGPRALVEAATAALGGLDILVCNASVQRPQPWRDITPDAFDGQVAVNLRATLQLVRLAAPAMLERRWGRILAVGSVQEARPHPDMLVYAATKCAQTSLVRNFARQFASRGVTVNALAPGVIVTDRNTDRLADAGYAERVLAAIPAGRFGETADCVGAALLLCSGAAAYLTGQNLFVDGGMGL